MPDRHPTELPTAVETETVATLRRVVTDLRSLADDPVPAVRGPVRLALADVVQILNALGADYDLYAHELTR